HAATLTVAVRQIARESGPVAAKPKRRTVARAVRATLSTAGTVAARRREADPAQAMAAGARPAAARPAAARPAAPSTVARTVTIATAEVSIAATGQNAPVRAMAVHASGQTVMTAANA